MVIIKIKPCEDMSKSASPILVYGGAICESRLHLKDRAGAAAAGCATMGNAAEIARTATVAAAAAGTTGQEAAATV